MEKSTITRGLPIAKVVYSFLNDTLSSSFHYPKWNKGRIICLKFQLKRLQSAIDSSNGAADPGFVPIMDSHLPSPGSKIYPREMQADNGHCTDETLVEEKESELLALWICWIAHVMLSGRARQDEIQYNSFGVWALIFMVCDGHGTHIMPLWHVDFFNSTQWMSPQILSLLRPWFARTFFVEKLCKMLKDVVQSKPNIDDVKLHKSKGIVLRNSKNRQKTRRFRIKAPRSALPIGAEPMTDPTRLVAVSISTDMIHIVVAVSYTNEPDKIISRKFNVLMCYKRDRTKDQNFISYNTISDTHKRMLYLEGDFAYSQAVDDGSSLAPRQRLHSLRRLVELRTTRRLLKLTTMRWRRQRG